MIFHAVQRGFLLESASDGFWVSHRRISTAPLEWGEWQKRTFKWWPVLFDEYNLSVSGQYITFLPPIVLSAVVPDDDPSIIYSGSAEEPIVAKEKSGFETADGSGSVATSTGGGSELKYAHCLPTFLALFYPFKRSCKSLLF